ncbi:MAG: PIN domain-containing protein [Candidatus Woesearchaeota archaeon]
MELVVDATVLFAAIICEGRNAELFFEDRLRLVATSCLVDEFSRNVIARICLSSESEVMDSFDILKERLEILPTTKFPDKVWSRVAR